MKNPEYYIGLDAMADQIKARGFAACRDDFNRRHPPGHPLDLEPAEQWRAYGEFAALSAASERHTEKANRLAAMYSSGPVTLPAGTIPPDQAGQLVESYRADFPDLSTLDYSPLETRVINQACHKLAHCIRGARQCSRDSWQEPKHHKREYLRIKRESMQDARYWHSLITMTTERHTAPATGDRTP